MIRTLLLIIGLALSTIIFSQSEYFQQEVNYKIDVTLNDQSHTLSGQIQIEYINHSPDDLDTIYFHLWANAFKNRSTAFANQKLRTGSTKFYFAKDSDLGNFSDLNFQVDGQSARWELDAKHPDIALLYLPKTLPSQGRIQISTPFNLKIPASFSRLGHVGESYQMTQWYPKPAVYDQDGWHAMPYLDLGEFYSEFGSFDVSITLPENYVVGATGTLQTESEQGFLQQKVKETNEYLANLANNYDFEDAFPPSSSTIKTIRFTAEQVHDFAWFADKRFKVQKSQVTLPSDQKVDTWVMFTKEEEELWQNAINYVDRAVQFYSEKVGEYPYPHATAVQSALSAGGGMEYPMITVIGLSGDAKSLDVVITHEVGHNWFYGILAFNERDHAWLDEGINSYYDHRYTEKYYGSVDDHYLPSFLTQGSPMGLFELAYLYQARRNLDQAPATHSDQFSTMNYFLSAYEKPARVFKFLEKYLGAPKFDQIMQGFYKEWKFKHPQPNDFQQYLETTASKDLSWLFDGFISSNKKQDYALTSIKKAEDYQVGIKNRGDIVTPFSISGLKKDSIIQTLWFDGIPNQVQVNFPKGDYDRLVLDAERISLELNRKDNQLKTRGPFKKMEPPQLKFLGAIENDQRTTLYWLPALAWNNYDKTMLGLALYNSTLPKRTLEFSVLPMYALGSKEWTGTGNIQLNLFPKSEFIQLIKPSFKIKSFSYDFKSLDSGDQYFQKYARITPGLTLAFRKPHDKTFSHKISWQTHLLYNRFTQRSNPDYMGKDWQSTAIHQLIYSGKNSRPLHPFSFRVAFEQQSYEDVFGRTQQYLKADLEWKGSFTYQNKKHIKFRLFVGNFISNSARNKGAFFPGAYNLIPQGWNDYRFDYFHFGRTEGTGIWSQQVSTRDGGFKTAIGQGFPLGRSNSFIFALNLKADLPLPFPIKPYLDLGYFDNAMPTGSDDTFKDQFLWNGGLMLDLFDSRISLHFPLISSKNISDRFAERGKYWTRITFSLDLERMNPWELADGLAF